MPFSEPPSLSPYEIYKCSWSFTCDHMSYKNYELTKIGHNSKKKKNVCNQKVSVIKFVSLFVILKFFFRLGWAQWKLSSFEFKFDDMY